MKHHTIIFVPHARARFRKLRISNLQIALIVGSLVALTVASFFVIWSYASGNVSAEDVTELREENEALREVNQSFEDSIRTLSQQLAEYEERTRRLAIVVGLESLPPSGEAGLGGDELVTESAAESRLFDTPMSAMERIAERLDALTGSVESVEQKHAANVSWTSSVPSILPTRGLFTSGYGYRTDPITGGRAFHQGMDLSAQPGAPVKASADGIITRAGWAANLGKAVYLSHGFGLTTRYGHLSRIAVEPGQKVRRGDVIGYVGSTGRSTGYHLHYEVRENGKAINPLAYVLDRRG